MDGSFLQKRIRVLGILALLVLNARRVLETNKQGIRH